MFGYVRPALSLLSEEERGLYREAYCGLCHTMGERYGFLARFTLNYDFAFLAVLFSGEGDEHTCRRCPAHPFRKKRRCAVGRGMDAAADAAMILTWQKLRDDAKDKGAVRGLPARLLCLLFRRSYRKAKTALPAFAGQTEESLAKLWELEQARSGQLDRAADCFARILLAEAPACPDPSRSRALEQLLYHLGRWIYLVDARDDLEEDKKADRYNPIALRFAGEREYDDYLRTTMTHSLRLAIAAADLMELGKWGPIVENVLCKGLPAVQEAVFSGRWNELKRQKYSKETTR